MPPFGEYESFEACLAANQDKENPEAYCGALKAQLEGKGAPKGAIRKVLEALLPFLGDDTGLETIADGPEALVRDAGTSDRVVLRKSVPIVKVDAEERLVYGIVYEPDVADAHEDAMTKAEIRKACHGFMIRYATLEGDTGVDHVSKAARHQVPIVESFIAPVDFTMGAQRIPAGSWVMAAKVLDRQIWKDVKAGKYTGWSFEGFGRRIAA